MPAAKRLRVLEVNGIPFVGETSILSDCYHFIHLNWSGYADRIFKASDILNGGVHLSWYRHMDKGGFSLFGVNKDGKVICAMVLEDEPGVAPKILVGLTDVCEPYRYYTDLN